MGVDNLHFYFIKYGVNATVKRRKVELTLSSSWEAKLEVTSCFYI